MPRTRRRRWLWLAVALLVPAASVGALVLRYPGLSSGVVHQLRYSTFEESRNLWLYVRYLTAFLEKLSYDPERGIYDFQLTPDEGLDDFERGRLAYHRGRFAEAGALLARHVERHGESERALFWLALAGMREAEESNCLSALHDPAGHPHAAHDPASYCTLPVLRTHEREEPSRRAAHALERLLELAGRGSDGRLYRWLLNFSYMTVGGFPAEVPEHHRIDTRFVDLFYGAEAARRRREHSDLAFVDGARELGVDNFGTGRGVAVEDLDGDGDLDLVSSGSFGGVKLFLNQGGTGFVDATDGSGLEPARQPMTVSVADYDGDGDQDLFVVCPYSHYRLFANRGDARFDDVTAASGLLDPLPPETLATSWMSAWGDVDNDGDLDLFVAGWAFRVPFLDGLPALPRLDSKLFVNQGGGRFRDATRDFGLARRFADRHVIGAAFGDYDGDGWLDLYVTGPIPGTNVLLRNREGRRFEPSDKLEWTEPGFVTAFVDVDHDGRLDLFHGGFTDARTAVTSAVYGERTELRSGRNVLFLQGADGRFEPRPDLFDGADLPIGSMGASFGDLDNDGCLDFYIGTGNPEPWFVLPNLMYRGVAGAGGGCGGRMENVSMLAGFGTVQKGHGIVFFDFDDDGDQDVYSSLGGMWPADPWYSQMFVNRNEDGGAWVKIRLRGRRSNRFGLGSKLEVHARRADGTLLVRTYLMDGKTGFGSAPQLAHVGLGPAASIDHVTVRWQGSGCVDTYPAALGTLSVLDEADCLERRTTR